MPRSTLITSCRRSAAVLLLAAFAGGACSPADWPTLTGDTDNRFSGPWDGVYEGTGFFSNPALSIRELSVNVTVQVTDLGDNAIRVQLFLRPPNNAYSPVLRLEGPMTSVQYADLLNLHELSHHHASLTRNGDGVISGLMEVQGTDEQAYWSCAVRVYPDTGR